MFTGIVEKTGRVVGREQTPAGVRLCIDGEGWGYKAKRGESVCVNGVCLTAIEDVATDGLMRFDVIPQTLSLTGIGMLAPEGRVNLERAAAVGDLIGGHMVQGHIDGLARVVRIQTEGQWRVTLELPATVGVYMVPKGSVALDGVSLTLADVSAPLADGKTHIDVTLIPETLSRTTLADWAPGSLVNIEADATAKTIIHFLKHWKNNEHNIS
jgi:riboflavin synthase